MHEYSLKTIRVALFQNGRVELICIITFVCNPCPLEGTQMSADVFCFIGESSPRQTCISCIPATYSSAYYADRRSSGALKIKLRGLFRFKSTSASRMGTRLHKGRRNKYCIWRECGNKRQRLCHSAALRATRCTAGRWNKSCLGVGVRSCFEDSLLNLEWEGWTWGGGGAGRSGVGLRLWL